VGNLDLDLTAYFKLTLIMLVGFSDVTYGFCFKLSFMIIKVDNLDVNLWGYL
jgi:hypothetical protein